MTWYLPSFPAPPSIKSVQLFICLFISGVLGLTSMCHCTCLVFYCLMGHLRSHQAVREVVLNQKCLSQSYGKLFPEHFWVDSDLLSQNFGSEQDSDTDTLKKFCGLL